MKTKFLIFLLIVCPVALSQSVSDIDSSINHASELMSVNATLTYETLQTTLEESKVIGYKKGEADSYYKLSEYYRNTRKGEECIDALYKALDIYKEIGNRKGEADVYNDIALSYEEFGVDGDVLGFYSKSLNINKEIGNTSDVIVNYINISGYYVSQEDYETGMSYLDTSIVLAESMSDYLNMAASYNSKGYLYHIQGEAEDALDYYHKALDIFKKEGDSYYQIPLIINICSIYLGQEDRGDEAIELLEEAVELSIEVDDKFYTSLAYKFMHIAYAKKGDYKEAYENHKLYKSYNDSLNDNESEKRLVELKMQNEFALEKEQIALEQEKKNIASAEALKRTEIIRNSFIGGFVLILIIAIVSFRAFKLKKKTGEEIAEKNKEITDSINYAERLQTAILSHSNQTDDEMDDLFVFFQPKDIVSGDFYWVEQNTADKSVTFAAIDCTGHGVPGAMLSIVGNTALEKIIHNEKVTQPSAILDRLNDAVYSKLKVQGNREMRDGMDVAFCKLDREKKVLEFAGANNPVYIVRGEDVIVHKGTKRAIGQKPGAIFHHNEIFLQEGDCVYVFSDGYADQFGGERGKKLGSKEFKRFLVSINNYDMDTQRRFLHENIEDWMSSEEQIDDICVIGMRV